VLHGAGREAEALAAFERALAIAPDDEATLLARAAMFRDVGRVASAAADLEHLAEVFEADGRRADALVVAREAVVLTATAGRRALLQRLEQPEDDSVPRSRPLERRPADAPAPAPAKAPAAPAAQAAERPAAAAAAPAAEPAAERPTEPERSQPTAPTQSSTLMDLYDAPIADEAAAPPLTAAPLAAAPVASVAPAPTAPEPAATELQPETPEPAELEAFEPAAALDAPAAPPDAASGPDVPGPLVPEMAALNPQTPGRISLDPAARDPGSEFLIQLEPDADPSASIPWPAIDLPSAPPPPIVGPPPDPEVLMAQALALVDGGDPKAARNLMLTAVMVHRAAGRPDAAIDVCLQLLALFPGDAHVHLAIAGLQLDRGWRGLATDKIGLLLRLTALTGDTQAEADAHALAAERLRDEQPSSFARA
jgi:tetratricopeptide (TPR) repeat protein